MCIVLEGSTAGRIIQARLEPVRIAHCVSCLLLSSHWCVLFRPVRAPRLPIEDARALPVALLSQFFQGCPVQPGSSHARRVRSVMLLVLLTLMSRITFVSRRRSQYAPYSCGGNMRYCRVGYVCGECAKRGQTYYVELHSVCVRSPAKLEMHRASPLWCNGGFSQTHRRGKLE